LQQLPHLRAPNALTTIRSRKNNDNPAITVKTGETHEKDDEDIRHDQEGIDDRWSA
jgi:hypothetical protein